MLRMAKKKTIVLIELSRKILNSPICLTYKTNGAVTVIFAVAPTLSINSTPLRTTASSIWLLLLIV